MADCIFLPLGVEKQLGPPGQLFLFWFLLWKPDKV